MDEKLHCGEVECHRMRFQESVADDALNEKPEPGPGSPRTVEYAGDISRLPSAKLAAKKAPGPLVGTLES